MWLAARNTERDGEGNKSGEVHVEVLGVLVSSRFLEIRFVLQQWTGTCMLRSGGVG